MDFDEGKIDDAVLALLYFTLHEAGPDGGRAWKSHDWDVLDRLHEKGYISDPKSKAKSVFVSPEGVERGRTLFEKLFCR